jgi:hypothetical protein
MTQQVKIVIHDAATGEKKERPMTADELATYKTLVAAQETLQAEQEEKEKARESALAKLAALGLTEEEIGAL